MFSSIVKYMKMFSGLIIVTSVPFVNSVCIGKIHVTPVFALVIT